MGYILKHGGATISPTTLHKNDHNFGLPKKNYPYALYPFRLMLFLNEFQSPLLLHISFQEKVRFIGITIATNKFMKPVRLH